MRDGKNPDHQFGRRRPSAGAPFTPGPPQALDAISFSTSNLMSLLNASNRIARVAPEAGARASCPLSPFEAGKRAKCPRSGPWVFRAGWEKPGPPVRPPPPQRGRAVYPRPTADPRRHFILNIQSHVSPKLPATGSPDSRPRPARGHPARLARSKPVSGQNARAPVCEYFMREGKNPVHRPAGRKPLPPPRRAAGAHAQKTPRLRCSPRSPANRSGRDTPGNPPGRSHS